MNVTILGGGIVGCAAAYELASRGARVRILDPRGRGQGATQASAGVLAPYLEGHVAPLLRLAACGLSLYDRFIERLSADADSTIEYRRTGTLQVACSDEEARELTAVVERLTSAGVAHECLDARGARAAEPGLGSCVTGALLVPQHGYVRVAEVMAALEKALARLGVTVTRARAERIDTASGSVRVTAADERIETDAVVVAAGSWSPEVPVEGVAALPVRPIRGQLLQVRCPAPPLSRVVWGADAYLVPWQDGRVLIGATSEDVGFDEGATVAGVRDLLDAAVRLVPALGDARFEAVRVGLRPMTPDELPVIGASSTMRGVYYASGHYRNGVLLAPLTASLIADLVLEGRQGPELALTGPDRFGL